MSISNYLTGIVTAAPKDQGYSVLDMEPDSTYMKTLAAEKAAKLEEKKSRLSQYSNADRDSYTQLPNGNIEDNKNKIWNPLTDDEYASVFSAGVSEYGLQRQADGTYVDPRGKVYKQDQVTNLYGYGTKESDDTFKMGVAANVGDGSSDNRYLPGRAKAQGSNYPGWLSGLYGVDVSKKQFDIALPKDIAETLEKLQHGRQGAIEDRLYPNANDPMAEAMVGSGKSEYYKDMQSVLATKSTEAGLDYDTAKGLLEQYRGLNTPKTVTPGFGGTPVNNVQSGDTKEDYFAVREADRMGVGDRLLNAVKAFPTAVVKELGLDTADWVGETLKRQTGWGWGVGTDEEKLDMAAGLFGYNKLLQERGVEKAKPHAENLYEAITDSSKDVKMDDVFGLIQAGLETPEMLTYSLGYLASMMVGTNKFSKTGKTINGIEKLLKSGKIDKASAAASVAKVKEAETISQLAGRVAGNNLGFATVVAGNVNDQIDEFKMNNNGVDLTAGQVFRMLGTETVMAGLDRFTDLAILRTPEALKELASAAKYVPDSKAAEIATKVVAGAAKLATAAGAEAAQEYTQTMGEIFNKQFQSDKYGDDALAILTNKDNVVEGIVSAAMGAAMGAEMKGIGMVAEAVASGTTAVANKVMENKTVKSTVETVQDVSKAIDDEITQFTSGASSSQPVVRAEVAGMAREDVIAAENAANNASEEIRQAVQLKVLAAMKARAEASEDSTGEVNAAKEVLTTATYRSEDRAAVVDALATLYSNDAKEAETQEAVVRSKLQQNSYSVEEIEEVVTEAKALSEALSAFKKVEGVTGKSTKTVSSEVLQEGRGGIAYYSGAMVGMVTGNEQMVEQYANSLGNLTALQSNKIATMDAGIATAKEGLVNDIANKLGVNITNDRYMERIREYVYGKRPISDNTPAVKRALTELKAEYEKAQARVSIWKGTVPVNGKLPEFQLNMGSLAESVRDNEPVGGLAIVEGVRREVKALETLQATLQKARVRKVGQPEEKATEGVTRSSTSTSQEAGAEYNEVTVKPAIVENTSNVQALSADQGAEKPQPTKASNRVNRYELLKDPKTKAAYGKVDNEVKEYTKEVKSLRDSYLKSQESRSKLQEGYTNSATDGNALGVKEAKLIEAENEYNLKVAEVRLQELEGNRDKVIGNVPMFTDHKEQLELAEARLEQAKAQAEYVYKLDTNPPDAVEFNNNVKVPLDREYTRLFNESIARREQSRNSRTEPQNLEKASTSYASSVGNSVSQIEDEDLSSLDTMADQYVSTEVDTTFDTNVTIDESTIPTWDDLVAEDTVVEREVYLDANEKVKLYQEYVDKIKAQKAEIAASKEAAYKAMKSMPEEVKSAVTAVVEDSESLIATIAEDVVKSGIISHIDTRIAEQEKLVSNAKKRLSEIAPNRKAVKPELRDEVRAILRDNAKSEKAVAALKQLQDNIRNCK